MTSKFADERHVLGLSGGRDSAALAVAHGIRARLGLPETSPQDTPKSLNCLRSYLAQKVRLSETVPVEIEVLGVEPSRGTGRLIGLAIVRIEVAGVELTLQGVRIERSAAGLTVHSPAFRHPRAGRYVSAVLLPAELREAIGAQVLEHLT